MSRACAWCGRVFAEGPALGWPWLPHGLCPACLKFIDHEDPAAPGASGPRPEAGGHLVAVALQSLRPSLPPAVWAPLWEVLVRGRPVVAVARERDLNPRGLDRVAGAVRGRLRLLLAARSN